MSSNEWKNYRLSDLINLIGGGTPKTNVAEYWNGNIPWLSVVDFGGDTKYVYDTEKHITEAGLQNSSTKILKQGQLIISARGTIGAMAILKRDMAFNQSCYGIDATEYSSNDFLYYLIKQNLIELKSKANGAVFDTITRETFNHIEVSVPKIEAQNKIAFILSSLDEKIENNLNTNKTLEEIARTIFKEWFANFNFPNADGSRKHSDFGEIPSDWELLGIGEVCYVQNGYAFKSNDFKEEGEVGIIKIKNINGNVVDIEKTDFVDANVVERLDKKFKIESGSLLIAMTGAEVGKIGLVPLTEKNLWLNQRVGMFKEKIAYGNLFMYLLLSSDTYQTNIQNSALGSAQPNISASAIESIRAIIPRADLIEAFGKIVNPMFEKILDNLAENETLKITRDSLLPKLMSGEIDVNISNA